MKNFDNPAQLLQNISEMDAPRPLKQIRQNALSIWADAKLKLQDRGFEKRLGLMISLAGGLIKFSQVGLAVMREQPVWTIFHSAGAGFAIGVGSAMYWEARQDEKSSQNTLTTMDTLIEAANSRLDVIEQTSDEIAQPGTIEIQRDYVTEEFTPV